MIQRLDEDGDLAPASMTSGTMEYRQLDVCVPTIGVMGAIQKLFSAKHDGTVWEDQVEVGSRFGDGFLYGSRKFAVWNESVSGRYGPTLSIVALFDETSQIPVYQEVKLSHTSAHGFVRCHPRAQIVRRGGDISVETPEVFAWAIFRKTYATRVGERWVAGNLYVRNDLSDEIQTELIAALAVVALS
jgi:hypothetical protein